MTSRYLIACIVLIALSVIATAIAYPSLPAQVPVHWNGSGQINGYGPRAVLWLTGPGLMSLMLLQVYVLPWLSPRRYDVQASGPTFAYVILVVVLMLGYFHALLLAAALGIALPVARLVPGGVFVLLILLGNPLGKVKRNFYIGIRTPWSIASERVWYATHRLAARLMVGSGLLGLAAVALAMPSIVILLLATAWAAIAVLYSLLLYKRLERSGKLDAP